MEGLFKKCFSGQDVSKGHRALNNLDPVVKDRLNSALDDPVFERKLYKLLDKYSAGSWDDDMSGLYEDLPPFLLSHEDSRRSLANPLPRNPSTELPPKRPVAAPAIAAEDESKVKPDVVASKVEDTPRTLGMLAGVPTDIPRTPRIAAENSSSSDSAFSTPRTLVDSPSAFEVSRVNECAFKSSSVVKPVAQKTPQKTTQETQQKTTQETQKTTREEILSHRDTSHILETPRNDTAPPGPSFSRAYASDGFTNAVQRKDTKHEDAVVVNNHNHNTEKAQEGSIVDLTALAANTTHLTVVRNHFSGTVVGLDKFLFGLERKLIGLGFTKRNSAILLNVCNDRCMTPFTEEIKNFWRDPGSTKSAPSVFVSASPAAFNALSTDQMSKTATLFGVKKVVCMYISHVAVEDTGKWGCATDCDQQPFEACRVLNWLIQNRNVANRERKNDNTVRQPPCSWDLVNHLRKTLASHLNCQAPSLPELTLQASRLITANATRSIPEAASSKNLEYMVCGAVLIHAPKGQTYVNPISFVTSGRPMVGGAANKSSSSAPDGSFDTKKFGSMVPTREQQYGG
eukprot:CAMPEP_0184659650 /NCGR_PEP_ID=MMETSP0308-20130426/30535_1 /TAXON_ID=38269 /ORGANISM="Gloeochaete witrockiana, Strain SAG 46.84" /LENGTH=569 /DNA_ID=CAMNT_0027099643 /DNA_START=136 /DNA_END=1845 /DNA_ORIENTATION=+